ARPREPAPGARRAGTMPRVWHAVRQWPETCRGHRKGTALLNAKNFVPSLPTLDPRLAFAPAVSAWTTWPGLSGARVELYYLARAGVYRAVRRLAAGLVALMPAYHHGVEVEAVRAAGATVRFYRVDERMQIDLDDLARHA